VSAHAQNVEVHQARSRVSTFGKNEGGGQVVANGSGHSLSVRAVDQRRQIGDFYS